MPVRVEGLVPVEVIGAEIGDDGDVGSNLLPVEMFKLEAAEFEHHPVVGADRTKFSQQAAADIATEPGDLTRRGEDGVNHRRGGRLAIAASDGNRAGRTQVPEQADLGCQFRTGRLGDRRPSTSGRHCRVDHHQVGPREVLIPVLPQSPGDRVTGEAIETFKLTGQ
ncbi:MAG: hypothetical protein CM1200mP2_14060 [Planctomycetaceae bacterium]|nr:MAG: hypothetical protein CM1200mP2_14060 [Planctomycetaceae bacterium]